MQCDELCTTQSQGMGIDGKPNHPFEMDFSHMVSVGDSPLGFRSCMTCFSFSCLLLMGGSGRGLGFGVVAPVVIEETGLTCGGSCLSVAISGEIDAALLRPTCPCKFWVCLASVALGFPSVSACTTSGRRLAPSSLAMAVLEPQPIALSHRQSTGLWDDSMVRRSRQKTKQQPIVISWRKLRKLKLRRTR